MLRQLNNIWPAWLMLLYCSIHTQGLSAAYFMLENSSDTVIGELRRTESELKDTLLDIARANDLGYQDIKLVNPDLDTWLPGDGKEILLPLKFILPMAPRHGIVLNIPEMRLYYYPDRIKGEPLSVITYPLGVGREGWSTPYVSTSVIEKKKDPVWLPPKSIRDEHAEMDDPLPERVEAGPDNPLGEYALRLGLPQYLIHGTNKPFGIGMRVSHGCIRLYPEHIEQLFEEVKLGTPVKIVNQPYKVGQRGDKIYLEAHPYLEEDAELFDRNMTSVVRMLIELTKGRPYRIDWKIADLVLEEMHGIPVEIGGFTGPPVPMQQDDAVKVAERLMEKRVERKKPGKKSERTVETALKQRDEHALKLRLETGLTTR